MVAEIVGGFASGSLALLADAGHMALDAAAVALGLFAYWVSKRPPDQKKTFGYYRAEILAATANAATLVLVALWIFIEAWRRLQAPQPVEGGLMSLVAAGGLVVNLIALLLMLRQDRHDLNMHGVWLHVLTDALGSASALVAAVLVWRFGWTIADPILSIVIGLLILFGAWRLLRDCIDVLLVSVPKGLDPSAIRRDLEGLPGVLQIHDLHVWAVNTGVNSVSAHVKLAPGAEFAAVLKRATELLSVKYGLEHSTLQLEPESFSHPDNHLCE